MQRCHSWYRLSLYVNKISKGIEELVIKIFERFLHSWRIIATHLSYNVHVQYLSISCCCVSSGLGKLSGRHEQPLFIKYV